MDITEKNEAHGEPMFGITKFTDMAEAEFREKMMCRRRINSRNKVPNTRLKTENLYDEEHEITKRDVNVPENWDWSLKKHMVGPARDQDDAGTCFAFASAGVLEGQYFKDKKQYFYT